MGSFVDLVGAETVHFADDHGELGGESAEDASSSVVYIFTEIGRE